MPLQLIGVSVAGLEPEFQPVVNHLLPSIISHKQDAHDMHLQVDDHSIYHVYRTLFMYFSYIFISLLMPTSL